MKKNKIIASFLVLALIVTLVAPSFALAATPDTSNIADAKTKAAADKLVALGVFVGDDNGDLGIEDNFTRAQFATVISRIAGFENAAKALGNQATGFSDVPADHWGSGYIAAATARGYLKGDTAGTFRPDADISYAEALTVLMRILGYKDEFLPGTWPANFMVAGDQVGLIGDDFVANVAIARGAIMKLTSEVIEKDIVTWDDKKLMFVEVEDNNGDVITLLSKNFAEKTQDARLKNVNAKDKKLELIGTADVKFAASFDATGKNALRGHNVTIIKNKDGEVVGLVDAQKANETVVGTAASSIAVNSAGTYNAAVKADAEKTYKVVTGAGVYVNGDAVTSGSIANKASITAFLDKKDGDIVFIVAEEFENNRIVTKVNDTNSDGVTVVELKLVNNGGSDSVKINSSTVITLNGEKATLADIKKEFVLNYSKNNDGIASKINAFNKTIEGKVTAVKVSGDDKTITVNGASYKLANDVASIDNEYTLYLNGKDEVVNAILLDGSKSKFSGLIVTLEGYAAMNDKNQVVKRVDATILNEDGNLVTHQFDLTNAQADANQGYISTVSGSALAGTQIGTVYNFQLKNNKIVTAGAISTSVGAVVLPTTGTAIKVTKDVTANASVINVTGAGISSSYALASNVVVYDLTGSKQLKNLNKDGAKDLNKVKAADVKVATLSDIKKDAIVTLFNKDGLVKYVVMYDSGKVSDDKKAAIYGIFKELYVVNEADNKKTTYVVLNVNGADQTIVVDNSITATSRGALVSYIDSTEDGTYNDSKVASNVYKGAVVSDNKLTIAGTNYLVNADTKYVTVKVKNLSSGALSAGDNGAYASFIATAGADISKADNVAISTAAKVDANNAIVSVITRTTDKGEAISVDGFTGGIAQVVVIYAKK